MIPSLGVVSMHPYGIPSNTIMYQNSAAIAFCVIVKVHFKFLHWIIGKCLLTMHLY